MTIEVERRSRTRARGAARGRAWFAAALTAAAVASAHAEPAGVLCRFRDLVAEADLNVGTDQNVDPFYARVANGVLFVSGDGGMLSVDVSNPIDPRPLGRWEHAGIVGDFGMVGSTAYAAVHGVGLVVLDWSDPAAPLTRATLAYDADVAGLHAEPGLVLLSTRNTLHVIDTTDPDAPVETGSVGTTIASDVVRVGDLAYLLSQDYLRVYDLAAGDDPVYLRQTRVYRARRFAQDAGRLFIACEQNGVAEVDLSDPIEPIIHHQTPTPGSAADVTAAGGTMFVADRERGLIAYDAADAADPRVLGSFETLGSATTVAVDEGFAFLAHEGGVLRVIDLSRGYSTEHDDRVIETPQITGVAINGALAHLAVGSGVRLYRLDAPGGPAAVAEGVTLSAAADVVVRDGLAFVADNHAGLTVLDAATLRVVGNADTPGQANTVALHGDHAYLGTGSSGVQILDVSDPAHPALVGVYDTPGTPRRLRVRGQRLIVAAVQAGTLVLDLTDPAAPAPIAAIPSPSATAADMEGDLLFVADGVQGLTVYDLSDPAHPVVLDHEPPGDLHVSGMTIEPDRLLLANGRRGVAVYERPTPGSLRLVGLAEVPRLTTHAEATDAGVFAFGAGVWRLDLSDCPPCPADLADPAGVLNFFDLAAYLSLFNAGDAGADLAEPPGVLNFFDLSAYLGLFNAGCP